MNKPHNLTFSRRFSSTVEPTVNVKAIAAAFGLGINEDLEITLYENLEVPVGAGRIIYITGDSGAGKSCLLRDIKARTAAMEDFMVLTDPVVGDMPDKPLVDQFGDWGIKAVCEILAQVGIAEPFVYLRKPRELSDGQRYRFVLAAMIYQAQMQAKGRVPIVCIDEFLAFLDRETARNVAFQIRRVSIKHQMCFVVATTHNDFERDLQANTTITLRLNLPPELKARPLASI